MVAKLIIYHYPFNGQSLFLKAKEVLER